MDINSNKNNKTKESLNSDGHQFRQKQHNKQQPLILTVLTEHKADHMWNPGPGSRQAQKYGGITPINGILTLPSW